MRRGFLYLVAIMDWATRKVLAWRVSNTMEVEFCLEALEEALARHGRPEIFNTDQGSQFTSPRFTGVLKKAGIRVSMDGRGRWLDNVFIERLWRAIRSDSPHWMRNALAHVPKGQHSMVAAALRQAFLQPDRTAAGQTWRQVADQLRARWPKLASLMDEIDVLAYLTFPSQHRAKLHSTNPLERLNKEVKRRADVVGIFPGEAAIIRLIGAVLLEQNDEWQTGCRYMQLEGMAELMTPTPTPDAEPAQIPPKAA